MSFSSCGKLKLDPKAIGSKGGLPSPFHIDIEKSCSDISSSSSFRYIQTSKSKAEIRDPLLILPHEHSSFL